MAKRRRSNGTGGIWRGKDGYWNAQAFAGYRNGKAVYARKRSKNEADVVAWLNAQLATGDATPPVRLTTGDYLTRWLATNERAWSFQTHKVYTQIVTQHLKPAIGPIVLKALTRANVQQVIDRMHDAGSARNTVRNVRNVVRKALNDAIADGTLTGKNVAALTVLPKAAPQPPRVTALTPEQAQTFLAAVEHERWKALYWTALLLGLRRGEVLGLRLDDLDLDAGLLRISGALQQQRGRGLVRVIPKTAQSNAALPLPAGLVTVLRAHLTERAEEATYHRWHETGLVFTTSIGTGIAPRNLVTHFKRVLARAKLPAIRFHDLRHSCATLLITLGTHPRVVMEILRHAQISTTMNIYAHSVPEINRSAVDALGDLLAPPTIEIPARKPKDQA